MNDNYLTGVLHTGSPGNPQILQLSSCKIIQPTMNENIFLLGVIAGPGTNHRLCLADVVNLLFDIRLYNDRNRFFVRLARQLESRCEFGQRS